MLRSDVIDYKIHGNDMQYVEVELDPGEATIAEAGTMMFKSTSVEMTTISGDGTGQTSGVLAALKATGKRVLTGERLFSTVFTNMGRGKARVAFANRPHQASWRASIQVKGCLDKRKPGEASVTSSIVACKRIGVTKICYICSIQNQRLFGFYSICHFDGAPRRKSLRFKAL